ncbi:MAG: 4-alpha-glucanotransferase [Vampirovibrionales bacterium]|nr:4-alpha-glucanotransferase [Vampirovibrionales bacterium]
MSLNIQTALSGPDFQADMADYQSTVKEALTALGTEDLSLIIHGSSFPSLADADTGFGSPYGEAAKTFLLYLKSLGFNGVQLGPGGKTKAVDASPYVSTTFSGNPLFIDLAPLVSQGLLSQASYKRIIAENPAQEVAGEASKKNHKTAYDYIYVQQAGALQEAFETFEAKAAEPAVAKMRRDFDAFCAKNAWWLEKDALYEALAVEHQNDYWPQWPSDLDKRLLNPQASEQHAAEERVAELKSRQAGVIRRYQFEQWLLDCQKQAFVQWATSEGIKLIADRQVGFADRDVWAYQTLFMQEWALGAPPDYFSKNGQAWDMPVLNPDLLFMPDGGLGPGGEFLKSIFDKTFCENPGGVRIDHIIGLIDPWIYLKKKSPKLEDGAGRLFSSPEHPLLGRFSKARPDQVNHQVAAYHEDRIQHLSNEDIERYAAIIRLVADCAKAHDLPLNAVICEDLGTLTNPVKAVLDVLGLSGVRVSEFVDTDKSDHLYRGRNVAPQHWIMPGSHDNEPLYRWVKKLFEENRQFAHTRNLREDLQPAGSLAATFALPFGAIDHDPKAFLLAKYAELFASPSAHVQVFFSDFFAIDALYNKPGQGGKSNWALRLPNAYDECYAKALKRQTALNLPMTLHLALASRLSQAPSESETRLLDRLAHWATVCQKSAS